MKSVFKTVVQLIRRGLLCLVLIYWACLIGNSVVKLIEGGPSRVIALYRYLGAWVVSGTGGTFVIHKFDWRQCLAIQFFYLAVTLALCFFEWRPSRVRT